MWLGSGTQVCRSWRALFRRAESAAANSRCRAPGSPRTGGREKREGGRERGAGREPSGAEARAEKAEATLEGRGAQWEGSWPLTPRPRRSGARRRVPPAAAARLAPVVLYSAPVADHTAPAALRPRPAGWTAHSWASSLAASGLPAPPTPGRERHSTPFSLLVFSASLFSHHSSF